MSHWGPGFQQDQVPVCHVCGYCGRGAGVCVVSVVVEQVRVSNIQYDCGYCSRGAGVCVSISERRLLRDKITHDVVHSLD